MNVIDRSSLMYTDAAAGRVAKRASLKDEGVQMLVYPQNPQPKANDLKQQCNKISMNLICI